MQTIECEKNVVSNDLVPDLGLQEEKKGIPTMKYGLSRGGWFVLVAALGLSDLSFAQAQGAAPRESKDFTYVTPNESLSDLPLWMTRHYQALQSEKRLPLQGVVDDVGTSVLELTFRLGLLKSTPGKFVFPAEMDKLICSLNSTLCRIGADNVPRWSNKKGDRICLPEVEWEPAFHFISIPAITGPDLANRLERKYGTCAALGARCEEVVKSSANRVTPEGLMTAVVLAQKALKASPAQVVVTSCRDAPTSQASERLEKLAKPFQGEETGRISTSERDGVSTVEVRLSAPVLASRSVQSVEASPRDTPVVASPASAASPPPRPVGEMLESIGSAALASTSVVSSGYQVSASVGVPEQSVKKPSEVVSDIFAKANLSRYRSQAENNQLVRVFVFDWDIDVCHHAFYYSVERSKKNCPDLEFSEFTFAEPTYADHGSHIAAIIAGAFGIGVSPHARIVPVKILESGVTRMDGEVYAKINDALIDPPLSAKVANFSVDLRLEQPSLSDRVGATIQQFPSILFVAAAGDEYATLDGPCTIMPACAPVPHPEANNLMVVGGATLADNQWTLWPSSRFGMRVDILAPAEDVVSAAFPDGKITKLTGSSQSAALISGIAARLFQAPKPFSSDWSPAQVKNRLLATVRVSPKLDRLTRSGVVDGDRALDTGSQILVVRRNGTDVEYRGKLISIVNKEGEEAESSFPFLLSPTDRSLDFCRIYRLSRREGNWVVAYQPRGPQAAARWGYMKVEFGAEMSHSTKALVFRPDGGSALDPIPINDVVDFFDKFSGDFACTEQD